MEHKIIENTTCFREHEVNEVLCDEQECRCWFDNPETCNCIILAAKKGPHKQEQIGKYFGLTRMRVCQIEKSILEKVREFRNSS